MQDSHLCGFADIRAPSLKAIGENAAALALFPYRNSRVLANGGNGMLNVLARKLAKVLVKARPYVRGAVGSDEVLAQCWVTFNGVAEAVVIVGAGCTQSNECPIMLLMRLRCWWMVVCLLDCV